VIELRPEGGAHEPVHPEYEDVLVSCPGTFLFRSVETPTEGGPTPSTLEFVHSKGRLGRLPLDPVEEARRQWRAHGWSDAADGMAAVTSIMRAQQILLARTDAVLRPLGLTFARYEVLMLLLFSRRGALPMKTLGDRLQVHPTSVTNAVARLEDSGLVRREQHPDDGRAVLVTLLGEGRERAEQATAVLNEHVFADPGVPPQRISTLVNVLEDLRRSAGDF
jgi:DNA-binding MarR family transcriptional regulator